MTTGLDRRRMRPSRVIVMVVAVVVAGWAVVANATIQRPRIDRATEVDAVLVLGGLNGPERTRRALTLVNQGLTDTIVLSMPEGTEDDAAKRLCADPPSDVRIICFRPDPSTTRGEAREIAQLAAQNSWSNVAVVTSTYHVARSRMIVERCWSGGLVTLASNDEISLLKWAYQYAYETLGWLKAQVLRGC